MMFFGRIKGEKREIMNRFALFFVFVITLPLFVQCGTTPSLTSVINSNEIQDQICIVTRYLHPNMDRYLKTLISEYMAIGDSENDDYASELEAIRRGGFGSGFIYVDAKGDNFIITNYHVIVGAYRLSITVKSDSGQDHVFQNLFVLNADEEADLAILAFSDGLRPYSKGVKFTTTPVRTDADIRAAGYGGMSNVPVWGFSRGSVINSHITPPGMSGWYIQHDAPINPGNSGGPLLIADRNSPFGYSVAGINTFYLSERQGSNFAIPSEKVLGFINDTFAHKDRQEALRNQVDSFISLLEKSRDRYVYNELFSFLSDSFVSLNPAVIVKDLERYDNTERILEKIKEDPVIGIGWAVAHNQIEMYIYRKNRDIQVDLISIEPNNYGGYSANMLISNYPYRTEWVWEYGTWKLEDFTEDDGEYNDYPDFATILPLGKKLIYSLSSQLDHDWYILEVPRAGKLTVWTEGNSDPQISLFYDPSTEESRTRTLIGRNDDISQTDLNARVSENVRAGKVYIWVRMAGGKQRVYTICTELE